MKTASPAPFVLGSFCVIGWWSKTPNSGLGQVATGTASSPELRQSSSRQNTVGPTRSVELASGAVPAATTVAGLLHLKARIAIPGADALVGLGEQLTVDVDALSVAVLVLRHQVVAEVGLVPRLVVADARQRLGAQGGWERPGVAGGDRLGEVAEMLRVGSQHALGESGGLVRGPRPSSAHAAR